MPSRAIATTNGLFDSDEVLLSAGGSAIFDLVAPRLTPALGRPVRGLLRSGCYVTHDHGTYKRFVNAVEARLGCALRREPAARARGLGARCSRAPSPGSRSSPSAGATSRSTSSCRSPIARAPRGAMTPSAVPASWKITAPQRPARLPALGRRRRRAGAAGRRTHRPRHLAPLHHLRQVALDADGRRRLPRRRRRGHACSERERPADAGLLQRVAELRDTRARGAPRDPRR